VIETINTTADLLKFHEEICEIGRGLIKTKNHDYAYGADVFQNFRRSEEYGIIVRAGDKLQRMENFEKRNGLYMVRDESIMDTAIDLVNYSILYLGYKRSGITQMLRAAQQKREERHAHATIPADLPKLGG
jgi:hypothetical protein